jgi:hypothetical protein
MRGVQSDPANYLLQLEPLQEWDRINTVVRPKDNGVFGNSASCQPKNAALVTIVDLTSRDTYRGVKRGIIRPSTISPIILR